MSGLVCSQAITFACFNLLSDWVKNLLSLVQILYEVRLPYEIVVNAITIYM